MSEEAPLDRDQDNLNKRSGQMICRSLAERLVEFPVKRFEAAPIKTYRYIKTHFGGFFIACNLPYLHKKDAAIILVVGVISLFKDQIVSALGF